MPEIARPGGPSHISGFLGRIKRYYQLTPRVPRVPRINSPVHAVPEVKETRNPVLLKRVSDLLQGKVSC